MRECVEIENIEEMRLQAGIEDVELRQDIRKLAIGDFVVLTLLSGDGTRTSETWEVRITAIRGSAFRGKLAKPLGPARQQTGTRIAFRSTHIHSLPKGRPSDG
jgi:hypothetical protein